MTLVLLVLIRVISNPLSNVLQKKLVQNKTSSLFIIFVTHTLLTIAAIPFLKYIFPANLPLEYFIYMLLCAVFAVSSNALLVKALSMSDLSLLGPINSYKSIVSLIIGIFIIHEVPSLMGLSGVILILFGSYFIADNNRNVSTSYSLLKIFYDKGVQLRIAALILSATEAVFLKKALMFSTPMSTFGVWCIAGFIISGVVSLLYIKNRFYESIGDSWGKRITYFNLFLTTGLMQLCTLLVFEKMQVSYALALFQISTLLSVFFGYKYFQEKNIKRRLAGSFIMIIGSVLIIIYGK